MSKSFIDRVALMNYIGENVKYNSEDPLKSYSDLLAAVNDAPAIDLFAYIRQNYTLPDLIREYLTDSAELFCDKFCKKPDEYAGRQGEMLMNACLSCPITFLIG